MNPPPPFSLSKNLNTFGKILEDIKSVFHFSSKFLSDKSMATFVRDAFRNSYQYSCKVIIQAVQSKSRLEWLEQY